MASKRAVSVPAPNIIAANATNRRAKSESTTDRVRNATSEGEALALLMDASRAEKKKRIAAKVKNQTILDLQAAARNKQGTKRRILDAPTEEAALEILLTASAAEAKRRKQCNSDRASRNVEYIAGAVPVEVCPAHGQGAVDTQTGSRGGSESLNENQSAAPLGLLDTNSPLHTPFDGGDASCANSCPWQRCQVPTSSGPTTTNGNSSAQHQSAEIASKSNVGA